MTTAAARGRIVIDLFTTLDGVAQAPNGREEDPSGGFRFGGWQSPFDDAVIGQDVGDGIRRMDALLLGRRTYELFAAYWPRHINPRMLQRMQLLTLANEDYWSRSGWSALTLTARSRASQDPT